jgi:hypothetical protein
MTLQEELSDIRDKAKSLHGGLIAMGCKATILYKLEQVIKLCQGEATPENVAKAKEMLWSLRHEDGVYPN